MPFASPAKAAPIVSPDNTALAPPRHPPIQPPLSHSNDVAVVAQHRPEGLTPGAKKPAGYVSVIRALYDSHIGVNTRVTLTAVLPATRSQSEMVRETSTGAERMDPDETKVDDRVSLDVFTLTPTAPAVAAPIASPLIVTVNAVVPIVAPDVVITNDVAVVAPHVAVSPATLLAPDATVGVTDGAKKPEG